MTLAVSRAFMPAIFAVLAFATLDAHHGNASFDTSKQVTLNGTVTEWIWANPHCFLKIDAMDETGSVRNWALETQNPTAMTQRGFSRTLFKAGDEVTVIIEPVKNGQPIGRLLTVVLANGQKLIAAPPTTLENAPLRPQ